MVVLYRVQTMKEGDSTPWTITWKTTASEAHELAEEWGPAYVDRVDFGTHKAALVELLNLADSNREALGQQFHIELVKKWPDPGDKS